MWRIHLKGVAYTSSGGGVYVLWGWRIHPMGVAYTSNVPIRPKGHQHEQRTEVLSACSHGKNSGGCFFIDYLVSNILNGIG